MLLPSIFSENLFDDLMDFSDVDRKLYGRNAAHLMKTDVHENESGYELDIDLPGFKKEDIKLSLTDGYLSVRAAKNLDEDKKDIRGKIIRQERYSGSMQRSFYVGDNLTETDIKAKFEDGVLKLNVPKKEEMKIPETKTIAIEG
ncbi:MAG: Hsp20/alpha crystallin family protein [Lachnospiraceae bacterium]|nr:Hsp20/alpha crystallin family protein [Lachnospiraceae bacterium]